MSATRTLGGLRGFAAELADVAVPATSLPTQRLVEIADSLVDHEALAEWVAGGSAHYEPRTPGETALVAECSESDMAWIASFAGQVERLVREAGRA